MAAPDRQNFITQLSWSVAKSNPVAAGAFFGGLVTNNPNSAFDSDGELANLATTVIADNKLRDAIGDILGTTPGAHGDKDTLTATLIAGQKVNTQSLIVQGVLRAGTAADVAGVLGAALPAFTAKSSVRIEAAGTVVEGNWNDAAKLNNITSAFAAAQTVSDKSKIGISIINAVGTDNPDSAQGAMGALIDSAGGVGDPLSFGLTVIPKIKSSAAAGAASAEIATRNGNPVTTASQLMTKADEAATDIAQRISALGSVADKTVFASQLADANPKFVENIAVGTSITDPSNSDVITGNVVTHDPAGDKKAIAKVGNIAGAVASVVDEENAADIAATLGGLMSNNGSTDEFRPSPGTSGRLCLHFFASLRLCARTPVSIAALKVQSRKSPPLACEAVKGIFSFILLRRNRTPAQMHSISMHETVTGIEVQYHERIPKPLHISSVKNECPDLGVCIHFVAAGARMRDFEHPLAAIQQAAADRLDFPDSLRANPWASCISPLLDQVG